MSVTANFGVDVIAMLDRMAQYGTAPREGCSLFGVGYEDAFARLRRTYLEGRFARGGSDEKFVVGPFGSGKTHFLRQLMELARDLDCATAEVGLNKDLDFTRNLVVYSQVAQAIRPPRATSGGIRALLLASLERVRAGAGENPALAGALLDGWLAGLDTAPFELEGFGRMVRRGIEAHLLGDDATFVAVCRWLGGELADRPLAKSLGVAPAGASVEGIYGRRALLSLFQFVRLAGFRGTVVAFDEAEQGLEVDNKKRDRIYSMLQSQINALADLENGSALIVYALTTDLVEKMERFAALQQRVADPGPGQGFFDGNTRAVRIPLMQRGDPLAELRQIGHRLVDLLYDHVGTSLTVGRNAVVERVDALAEEIVADDVTSASRRTMVKRTSALLIRVYEDGVLGDSTTAAAGAAVL